MVNTAITILLLPLVAFVLIVFVTRSNKSLSAAVSIVGMGIAAILSLFVILPATMAGQTDHFEFNWLRLMPGGVPAAGTRTFLRLGIGAAPLAGPMPAGRPRVGLLAVVCRRAAYSIACRAGPACP